MTRVKRIKGSSDSSPFKFEINVGKRRIRHITTLSMNFQSVFSQPRNSSFNFRVVLCRIRLFPTLISKIEWLGSGLPLKVLEVLDEFSVRPMTRVFTRPKKNFQNRDPCLFFIKMTRDVNFDFWCVESFHWKPYS